MEVDFFELSPEDKAFFDIHIGQFYEPVGTIELASCRLSTFDIISKLQKATGYELSWLAVNAWMKQNGYILNQVDFQFFWLMREKNY